MVLEKKKQQGQQLFFGEDNVLFVGFELKLCSDLV